MNTMQNIADRYGAGAHCAISYILDMSKYTSVLHTKKEYPPYDKDEKMKRNDCAK